MVRPTRGIQYVVDAGAGRQTLDRLDVLAERLGGLLRAHRRTGEQRVLPRQALLQPLRNVRRLLASLARERAREIRGAVFGFCVAPEDEIHTGSIKFAPLQQARSSAG